MKLIYLETCSKRILEFNTARLYYPTEKPVCLFEDIRRIFKAYNYKTLIENINEVDYINTYLFWRYLKI